MNDIPLNTATLTDEERALVERIAARREEIVALACELISFDTTSRTEPEMEARQEADLQAVLATRLKAAGAEVDVWEPKPEDVANHPLTGDRTYRFDGRPQLRCPLPGEQLGHGAIAHVQRPHRCRPGGAVGWLGARSVCSPRSTTGASPAAAPAT